jgi:hypothetical protein
MTTKLKRKLAAVAILAVSMTAAARYFARGQSQGGLPQSPVQSSEPSRQALITNQLRDLLTPVGVEVASGFQAPENLAGRQVGMHWETSDASKSAPSAEQAAGRFTVSNSRVSAGSLPRRRSVELAETEVFVVAVDESARLVWWHVMTDPRLLRSETVTETGEVSGRVLYQSKVDFSITFPDEQSIKELRLYHPQWTGDRFRLTSIGVISVR